MEKLFDSLSRVESENPVVKWTNMMHIEDPVFIFSLAANISIC